MLDPAINYQALISDPDLLQSFIWLFVDHRDLCDDIVQALRSGQTARHAPEASGGLPTGDRPDDLRAHTGALVQRTLADCAGNLSEAARRLGVSRNALYRRLRQQGEAAGA